MKSSIITVETIVNAPLARVWQYWTLPEHIVNWAFASDEWEASASENDLRIGGRFTTTMAAKDKSESFDFSGSYTQVVPDQLIAYKLDDNRAVEIEFVTQPSGVKIVQRFEPEAENSVQMQRAGWQAILDNFKKYAESD